MLELLLSFGLAILIVTTVCLIHHYFTSSVNTSTKLEFVFLISVKLLAIICIVSYLFFNQHLFGLIK